MHGNEVANVHVNEHRIGHRIYEKKRDLSPSWDLFFDYDMVSIPTNIVGTVDTPGIPTSFVGRAIPTMLMGTLHFD